MRLGGTEITGMNENELTELRRSRLGFVFQAFNLWPAVPSLGAITADIPRKKAGHP